MYILHAQNGVESATRSFTTFAAASRYGRRMAAFGWIVKAITQR
jgi:hypothetical protein